MPRSINVTQCTCYMECTCHLKKCVRESTEQKTILRIFKLRFFLFKTKAWPTMKQDLLEDIFSFNSVDQTWSFLRSSKFPSQFLYNYIHKSISIRICSHGLGASLNLLERSFTLCSYIFLIGRFLVSLNLFIIFIYKLSIYIYYLIWILYKTQC